MSGDNLIEVNGLARRFGDFEAVRGIDFQVGRGEVVGFLGPNGAGKSTTMQMLVGALAPSEGAVRIDGMDLLERPAAAKSRLGYLAEQPPLYRELTVDEYLSFCARLRGVPGRRLRAAVTHARERCGLAEAGRRLIGNLSRGYQQRVGIAQALVHEPAIVILDEPTSGLDPNQIREIRSLMRELGDAHCVVLSTHILAEVQSVCDRVVILHQGRIVLDRPLAGLQADGAHAHRLVLARAPDPAGWPALPGVSAVQALAEGQFRVEHDGGAATVEHLARIAAGWGLHALVAEQRSLEELFTALTTGDAISATAPAPAADMGPATLAGADSAAGDAA